MPYSLLSQFQGSIFGSIIGDILGEKNYQQHQLFQLKKENLLPGTQIGISTLENLTQGNKIEPNYGFSPEFLQQPELKIHNNGELILATLPIVLFFHDQPHILQQQLPKIQNLVFPSSSPEELLIWSAAITLTLQAKLAPRKLIPQLLTIGEKQDSLLGQKLAQTQDLLLQRASLNQVVHQLGKRGQNSYNAMILALYCFLSTPENFQLSVTRAQQIPSQSQLTAALTGAIAGAYNSQLGIPINWRLSSQPWSQLTILKPTEALFALWSGVYQSSQQSQDFRATVMKPR